MSVAFRRDSDEEHREPRFERPIPVGPNLVTMQGLAFIDARIGALTGRLANTGGEAAEAIRRDLRYWNTRRATAQPTGAPNDGTVGFGSVVDIMLNGSSRTLALVGDDEADPAAGRIPYSAPLARAMLGAEAGETLPFAGREDAITILSIAAVGG